MECNYGRVLSEILKERKLTQIKFSSLSGVSNSYISEIVRGEKIPSLSILNVICRALNMEMSDFFEKVKHSESIAPPDVLKYIEKLRSSSFDGFKEDEKRGFLRALCAIEDYVKVDGSISPYSIVKLRNHSGSVVYQGLLKDILKELL